MMGKLEKLEVDPRGAAEGRPGRYVHHGALLRLVLNPIKGELRIQRRRERFRAVELHGAERDAIVGAHASTITCGCRTYPELFPDPADHPVFRTEPVGDSG